MNGGDVDGGVCIELNAKHIHDVLIRLTCELSALE